MTEQRFILRLLPMPAKLVLAVFLLAVGLGYFSALVQLHLQHSSRNGEPLPSAADVVEIFAGKIRFDPSAPSQVCKLEKLVMGPRTGLSWNGSGSMAAAFFERDDGEYKNTIKDEPNKQIKMDVEREGERRAVQEWIHLPEAERKKAYEGDQLKKPADLKAITECYDAGEFVKVKLLLTERCARCHGKGADQEKYPLETYEQILKYMPQPETPDANGWIKSPRQMGVESLTQSTHAHLLTFAVLFGLTGFLFAFTSYPRGVRLIVAPLVLLAQVLDVSCWWLARLPDVGPYFAYAILGTGTVVGLGLAVQIVGCLFDMFGKKGRFALIVLFILAAAGFGVLYVKTIEPALTAEKAK
jgi:hypothetical protein